MPTFAVQSPKLRADFNGLFDELLCLSHADTCKDENGVEISLREGMIVTAYEDDANEFGIDDKLIATGVVGRSPDWLSCRGSVWSLHIDDNGVRHESEISSID